MCESIKTKAIVPLSCWKDFFGYQPFLWTCLVQSPLLSLSVLLLILLQAVAAVLPASLSRSAAYSAWFLLVVVACRLVPEMWSQLTGQQRQDRKQEFSGIPTAFAVSILYQLAWVLGLILLIVPGVIVMICGSLAIVFTYLERKDPLTAFMSSDRLIRGHFWQAFRYLVPPVLCFLPGIYIAQEVAILLIDPTALDVPQSASYIATGHLPASIIMFLSGTLMSWVLVSMILLQVKLYYHLKQKQLKATDALSNSGSGTA